MRVTFVVPKEDDRENPLHQFTQCRVLPPVGLARMAGLAGKQARVSVVDERIGSDPHNGRPDIAVFFINAYNRERCLTLARHYRELGGYVVLSGAMLANDSAQPAQYANSLFVGYGEECIADFLNDYHLGKAKTVYYSGNEARTYGRTEAANGYMALSVAS
ncbi:MAG: hypothetical protein PVF82_01365 [Gammaproteobacteria bacterium]